MTDIEFWNKWKDKGEIRLHRLNMVVREPKGRVFRIFDELISLQVTPVAVIVGQDPYPQKDTATGIAFANELKENQKMSPSLEVIRNSVSKLYDGKGTFDPTLMSWVKQGILPINGFWTVVEETPMSDALFWAPYTGCFLKELSERYPDMCYILMGSGATCFKKAITSGKILQEFHPAYYARKQEDMPVRVWEQMIQYIQGAFNKTIKLIENE